MAEADSEINSHVVTRDGSTDPRVKSTQVLSASFIENTIKALVRRGDTALTPWLGPDGPRPLLTGETTSIPGFLFVDGIGLDATTLPGTVTLKTPGDPVTTPSEWYGTPEAGRVTGLHSRRQAGSIEQGPVFFDIDLGTEIGVASVPVADVNTVLYSVVMNFSTIPKTVETNPRTGLFEYVEEHTVLGVVMEPASVNDLGGGFVELLFPTTGDDIMYIATDSMAGRTATAYLAGGPLAVTASAIESATITFSSGSNRFTVGDLGQATISTDPADYRVLVRGVTVTDFAAGFGGGGSPSLFDDMDSGVFIGIFGDFGGGVASTTIPLVAPTFANLLNDILGSGSDIVAGTEGGRRNAFKVSVKRQEFEVEVNQPQLKIKTNTSNPKYGGLVSWSIDEEGVQSHVTAEEDFSYIPDDATAVGSGLIQRTFTRMLYPLHSAGYRDAELSVVGREVVRGYDATNKHWWGSNDTTGAALIFYLPVNLNNCVIDEITVTRKRTAGGVLKIDFGTWDGTGFTSLLSAGELDPNSGTAMTEIFFGSGDFTEIEVDDGSTLGTLGSKALVVRVDIRNVSADTDMLIQNIKLTGRLLKNYPVSN